MGSSTEKAFEFVFEVILLGLIVLLGTVGNVLSLAVFSRKRFKNISVNFMFRIMCITDTLCLLQALQTVLFYAGIYNIRTQSELTCKLFPYLAYSLLPIKGWILVFIDFERYMSVKNPAKKLILQNSRIQVISIVYICVFNFLWYIPFMTNLNLFETRNKKLVCNQLKNVKKKVADTMDILNSSLVPFSLMIMFTVLIVMEVYRSKNRIGTNLKNLCVVKKEQKCKKFTITLVLTNLAFIFFNIPFRINSFLYAFYHNKLLIAIFRFICYGSFAMPIFIYVVTNSLFRKELLEMMGLKNQKKTANTMSTGSNLNRRPSPITSET